MVAVTPALLKKLYRLVGMAIQTVLWTLAGFGLLLFFAFVFGYFRGREKERQAHTAESLRKAESDRAFEREKEKIQGEVQGDAEKEKAKLSRGTGRERFDAINDSLRGKG